MHSASLFNILISLVVCLGSLTYGYAAAILGNTLEKAAFYEYMKLDPVGPGKNYADTIIAVWNTILYVGGIIACYACPTFGDRFGRKKVIALGAAASVLGAALQAGAIDPTMLIVARFIVGAGMGMLIATVPLYQAEIAPPSSRGLIVGLHASLIGYGSMIASWIGVAFYYTPGQTGWRAPLILQILFPLVLLVVVWWIPESPRWLYMHDRAEQAERVLIALHKNKNDTANSFAKKELYIIKQQIDYETANRKPVREAFRQRSLQKRFILGFVAMWNTQCTGLIVVLAYQSTIYESLGYSPFVAGIFGSIWCLLNGTGNLIGGMIGDYVGRKKQIVAGLSTLFVLVIALCITTDLYTGTDNKAGKTTAAVLTFLMIAVYATGVDCASLVYSSELFPGEWRAWGVSWSVSAVLWGCCIFVAAAPRALSTIGALYYVVFIVLTAIQIVIVAVFFPDTKGFTLEQMSAIFGDAVVDMHGHIEKAADFLKESHNIEKVDIEHVEQLHEVAPKRES